MKSAADLTQRIDYPNFPELDAIDLSLTDARTVITLQAMRSQGGFSIWPGLKQANWGRIYGSETSEHYAVGRLATACDVFPAKGKVIRFWSLCQEQAEVGGMGLYLDTKGPDGSPWMMTHFDLRQKPRLMWVRNGGEYWYDVSDPVKFWSLIRQA